MAITSGTYDTARYGSRIEETADYGGWATQWLSEGTDPTIPDVTDPMSMTEDQQSGALQVL